YAEQRYRPISRSDWPSGYTKIGTGSAFKESARASSRSCNRATLSVPVRSGAATGRRTVAQKKRLLLEFVVCWNRSHWRSSRSNQVHKTHLHRKRRQAALSDPGGVFCIWGIFQSSSSRPATTLNRLQSPDPVRETNRAGKHSRAQNPDRTGDLYEAAR